LVSAACVASRGPFRRERVVRETREVTRAEQRALEVCENCGHEVRDAQVLNTNAIIAEDSLSSSPHTSPSYGAGLSHGGHAYSQTLELNISTLKLNPTP